MTKTFRLVFAPALSVSLGLGTVVLADVTMDQSGIVQVAAGNNYTRWRSRTTTPRSL